MTDNKKFSGITDPDPGAEWELWYQDLFDRECPRQVEVSGQGLVKGLAELWARHLFETVGGDGQKGFSRFNLWWKQPEKSVMVNGEWDAMVRLRQWIFGSQQSINQGYVDDGDQELLMKVAMVHSYLVLKGLTSDRILTAAQNCTNRKDFHEKLLNLSEDCLKKD